MAGIAARISHPTVFQPEKISQLPGQTEKIMDMSEQTDPQPEDDNAAVPEAATMDAESTVETAVAEKPAEKPAAKRERQPKNEKREERRSGRTDGSLRQVTDRFAACGRCSYFWAGYRVLFGEEGQETAVDQSQSGWLALQWNSQMPDLLNKSYGIRLDIEHFHYEGCCKECRRRFVYHAAENEDELASCTIEISPHKAK